MAQKETKIRKSPKILISLLRLLELDSEANDPLHELLTVFIHRFSYDRVGCGELYFHIPLFFEYAFLAISCFCFILPTLKS